MVVVNEGNGRHERFSQWTAQLGTQDCMLKPIRQGQTVTLNWQIGGISVRPAGWKRKAIRSFPGRRERYQL